MLLKASLLEAHLSISLSPIHYCNQRATLAMVTFFQFHVKHCHIPMTECQQIATSERIFQPKSTITKTICHYYKFFIVTLRHLCGSCYPFRNPTGAQPCATLTSKATEIQKNTLQKKHGTHIRHKTICHQWRTRHTHDNLHERMSAPMRVVP